MTTTFEVTDSSTIVANRLRRPALLFSAAGILWVIGVSVQYATGTFALQDGPVFTIHQGIFTLAQLGIIVGSFGFARRDSLAGRTLVGRVFLRIFGACWIVIIASGVLFNYLGMDAAVAGLAVSGAVFTLAALGAGIAVAARPSLPGWPRWSLLIFGVYGLLNFLGAGLIGDVDRGPTLPMELAWAILLALVGVSVLLSRPVWDTAPTI